MNFKTILWLAACAFSPLLATAQTAPVPAKPPAVKAAPPRPATAAAASEGKTLSLGSGSGPILSRDQLRECFRLEETIRIRIGELDGRRAPLDAEKTVLNSDQAALRSERAPIDQFKTQADGLSARMKEYGVQVEAWNGRVADFNLSSPSGAPAERKRIELNKEREDLERLQKVLDAERIKLSSDSTGAVGAFNIKATAIDGRVADWNKRNEQWNQDAQSLEAERKGWVGSCADRRYREDDENAIKRGN